MNSRLASLSVCIFALTAGSSFAQSTGKILLVNTEGTEVIAYGSGGTAYVRVVDSDRNADALTAETLTVTLTSAVESAGEALTLTETGVATGIFTGSMELVEAATAVASDGSLQLERGKQITATYDDPEDDFGNAKTVSDKAFFGVTLVSGPYSINTTWRKASSPYLVTGDVTVQAGSKLTIEPGVEVRFLPGSDDQRSGNDTNRGELIVLGEIHALGTAADSIRFSSNADAPIEGDYYGIRLEGQNSKARFAHGVFTFASFALRLNAMQGSLLDTVVVRDSRFSGVGEGIRISGSVNAFSRALSVYENHFSHLGSALRTDNWHSSWPRNGSATVQDNVIEHHTGRGISLDNFQSVLLSDNVLGGPGAGINVRYAAQVSVENNRLDGSSYGIHIYDISNTVTLVDNTLSNTKSDGLLINGTVQAVVRTNTSTANSGSGLALSGVQSALVRHNVLRTNAQQGIYLERTTALVDSNTVSGNLQDGIYINTDFNTPVTDTLRYNTISGNGGDGIENQGYGRPVVNYNNLHSNVGYDVNNRSTQHDELNARFNFWGDAATAVMNLGGNPKNLDKIYDRQDEAAVGFVNYGGFLNASGGAPASTTNTGTILLVNDSGSEVIAYETGQPAIVHVVDSDRNADALTAETLTVTLTSAVESAGEALTLTETGVATGIFTGSMELVEAATAVASDGSLQLERGKQITATYDDPEDDFGNAKTVSDKAFFGVTLVSGPYSINTTWRKASSPYLVTGDVTVQAGSKLTIEPGVEVRFLPGSDDQRSGNDTNRGELIVLGEIHALGTAADSIRFSSNADAPIEGDYYGIRLEGQNSKARFAHGVFTFASFALRLNAMQGSLLDTVVVRDSRFSGVGEGIRISGSVNAFSRALSVYENHFSHLGSALRTDNWHSSWPRNGSATVQDNVIEHHTGRGISLDNFQSVLLSDNVLGGPGAGINVRYAAQVSVENNRLDGSSYGIHIYDISNTVTLVDNTLSNTKSDGLLINGTVQAVVRTNTSTANSGSGLALSGVQSALVRHNVLRTNAQQGIYLERTTALVDSNTVSGNLQDGIYINTDFNTPVTDTLRYNTISGNGGDGIENQGYGRPVVNYNNLHSNVGYDVNNRSTQHDELNARFNFWGDAATAVMNLGGNPKNLDKIYDRQDEAAVGFVNYGGFLNASGGAPASTTNTGTILLVNDSGSEVIAYETGQPAIVHVVDSDRNADALTAETLTVTLTSAVESAGEALTLTETGVATGIFTGSMELVEAATAVASDGSLQLERGKQITATYDDPEDDFGNAKTVSDKAFFGVTLVSGPYSINTTWRKASSPYLVTGDVTVQAGSKLTIEPGVEVRFLPGSDDQRSGNDTNRGELIVLGEIHALGTAADSIRFSSNADAPIEGDYYGIRLEGQNSKARFAHGVFTFASFALRLNAMQGSLLDTVVVRDSRFSGVGEGIRISGSVNAFSRALSVYENHFSHLGSALRTDNWHSSWPRNGSATVQDNVIEHHTGRGISLDNFQSVLLSDNVLGGPGAGINVRYAAQVSVENNRLDGSSYGIHIYDISNTVTLVDNTLSNTKSDGLLINGTVQAVVRTNTSTANSGSGLALSGVQSALVRHNVLRTNAQQGIYLERTTALADSNTVTGNLQDGIYIKTDFNTPATDTLRYNTITGNGGDGIENQSYGRPILNYNNLHSNVGYDVNNRSAQHDELNARFNFWGDAATAVMNLGGNPKNLDKIYDRQDEAAVGFVNYGGYLDAEIDVTAPPPDPSAPDFALTLRVSDTASHMVDLVFGLDATAGDGYDPDFDQLAPPPAPSGTFDGRFRGSAEDFLTDIRSTDSNGHTWSIAFQSASGATVSLSWDPDAFPDEGTFRLRDPFGGVIVDLDMRSASTFTPPTGITQLHVVYSAVEEVDVSVLEGWNMVGLPLDVPDPQYRTLFPTSVDRTLFAFAGNYVIPDPPSLIAGNGYWLRFPADLDVTLSGSSVRRVSKAMSAGWNMIAGPNCSIAEGGIADASGIITAGTLFDFGGAYVRASSVEPGRGYWLRASVAGTITMDCASAGKGYADAVLDGFTRLTLTDGRSRAQTLYTHGRLPAGTLDEAYTAPPQGPDGAFTAVFDGGRYVSEVARAVIYLTGATFPLELDLSGEPIVIEAMVGSTVIATHRATSGAAVQIAEASALRITSGALAEVPAVFALEQNYPNPFNPVTTIRFGLPEDGEVTLEVFDVLGRRVASLLAGEARVAGWHEVTFDASRITSGNYFYRIQSTTKTVVRQMVVLK